MRKVSIVSALLVSLGLAACSGTGDSQVLSEEAAVPTAAMASKRLVKIIGWEVANDTLIVDLAQRMCGAALTFETKISSNGVKLVSIVENPAIRCVRADALRYTVSFEELGVDSVLDFVVANPMSET